MWENQKYADVSGEGEADAIYLLTFVNPGSPWNIRSLWVSQARALLQAASIDGRNLSDSFWQHRIPLSGRSRNVRMS